MSQLSNFGSYSKEAAAKAKAAESSADWLKLKSGTNIIRLLPPWGDNLEPWVTTYQHFIKDPGGGKPTVFNCPKRAGVGDCPSCAMGERLNGIDEASKKAAAPYWPSQRNFAFAIDRSNPAAGIQVFGFGATIKKRLRFFAQEKGKDFTNFENGYDIEIIKTGEMLSTEYNVDLGDKCPVIPEMEDLEGMLTGLVDLNGFTKILDFDALVEKFRGAAGASHAAAAAITSGGSNVQDAVDSGTPSDDKLNF
jgi:hypothetical protein